MKETASPDINQRIAGRVRELRAARGLSLDALAAAQRREPLDDLADRARREQPHRGGAGEARRGPGRDAGLALRRAAPRRRRQPPVARRETQPQWRDPASGYLRRNVSPPGLPSPMQIVEVAVPAGRARGLRNRRARRARAPAGVGARRRDRRDAWAGSATGSRPATAWRCMLDRPTMFHNPTRKAARYAVAIATDARSGERMSDEPRPPGPVRRLHAVDAAHLDVLAERADRLRRRRRLGQLHAPAGARARRGLLARRGAKACRAASGPCSSPRTAPAHRAAPCSWCWPAREPAAPRRDRQDAGPSAAPAASGIGAALMRPPKPPRANAARRCWCSTPSPAAMPSACTTRLGWQRCGVIPDLRSGRGAGSAARRCSTRRLIHGGPGNGPHTPHAARPGGAVALRERCSPIQVLKGPPYPHAARPCAVALRERGSHIRAPIWPIPLVPRYPRF